MSERPTPPIVGIVCVRGGRRRPRACHVPGCWAPAITLCDHKAGRRRCSRPSCEAHGVNVGPDEDLCPEHAHTVGAQLPLLR